MTVRKRNEWLDAGDDESEGRSDIESDGGQEFSKARLATKSIKRRKVERGSADDESEADDVLNDADQKSPDEAAKAGEMISPSTTLGGPARSSEDNRFASLQTEDLDDETGADKSRGPMADHSTKRKRKSGVVYLSRIPPFMKPQALRSYLSPYGEIGKIFLTPEDHATYIRRKRSGGNKKHSFVDGWVEFLSKKDAKLAASTLNGNIMGGKKGNYYHDDIWNIKYLTGFKWDDLTDQIARENKEREARLRMEIAKAKRENEAFVRDVEKGKMLDTMENRRKERGTTKAGEVQDGHDTKAKTPKLSFKQNLAVTKQKELNPEPSASRVLSKLL